MELRHLRYFVAVAETLNFRQAAANLQMAQPPLSAQIKKLEQELDVRLFDRNKRRVRLTPAGEQFLVDAKATLAQATKAKLNAQRMNTGELGYLHLGFVGSVAYQWLPQVLKQFRHSYPDVQVQLSELTTTAQISALTNHALDIGIVRPPINSATLEISKIAEEAMVVALPSTHTLATQQTIELTELAQEPFVCFPRLEGRGSYDAIIAACRTAGFSPNIVQEAVQMSTLIGLVSAEIGVALVPASVAIFHHPAVTFVPLRHCPYTFQIALIWNKTLSNPAAHNFISMVRQQGTSNTITLKG